MFDFRGFLSENFGTPDSLITKLSDHGVIDLPQRAAVVKWFQRASIPGDWFAELVMVMEAESGHLDLRRYRRGPTGNDIFA